MLVIESAYLERQYNKLTVVTKGYLLPYLGFLGYLSITGEKIEHTR